MTRYDDPDLTDVNSQRHVDADWATARQPYLEDDQDQHLGDSPLDLK